MPTLSDFTDLVKSTAPAWASSREAFVNELQQTNYPLARFLRGRDMSTLFQNGERIKDGIILDDAGTFQIIGPETETNWNNPQIMTVWEVPWRFSQCYMTWTAQEVELNEGSSAMTWKRVKSIKQSGLASDCVNGINDTLFKKPNKATMETFASAGASDTGDPGEPYSIPAHVNEYANTLFDEHTTTPWTTHQTIDPTAKTKWQNRVATYGNLTANTASNLTTAFDDIVQDIQFQMPGTMNEYFTRDDLYRQVIFTTKSGIKNWKLLCRAENDVNVSASAQDPAWARPTYAGIPLERAPQLETSKLYGVANTASVSYTESDNSGTTANVTGPRYYFINANYMKMAFHDKYYFKYLDVFTPEHNRTKFVMPIQTWFNLYVTSRRRHGVVAPSTDL